MIQFPKINNAARLESGKRRLIICAYGFEERSLAWTNLQIGEKILTDACVIKYTNPKGKNKIVDLKKNLRKLGISSPVEIDYNILGAENIETEIEGYLKDIVGKYDEIIFDITSMTKFLILVFLCKFRNFDGTVRLIYSEANEYAPTEAEYKKVKEKARKSIRFPSKGFGTILRAKCLSSIRMQGQPVTLVAFTSFNEQLVRHMLGTISPHILIFINGKPPRDDYKWREKATTDLHGKLISEYSINNELSEDGLLKRVVSTLDYTETINCLNEIYTEIGLRERIIVAATGSKMQTIGLYFSKIVHPDMHIEYPTPDSYYIKGFSSGCRNVFEIEFETFKQFISKLN